MKLPNLRLLRAHHSPVERQTATGRSPDQYFLCCHFDAIRWHKSLRCSQFSDAVFVIFAVEIFCSDWKGSSISVTVELSCKCMRLCSRMGLRLTESGGIIFWQIEASQDRLLVGPKISESRYPNSNLSLVSAAGKWS